MVAVTSAPDRSRSKQSYRTIIIVGGGCYGSYYLRQLSRARNAGALEWDELLVVDRDEECAARRALTDLAPPAARVITSEWADYFDDFLSAAAESAEAHAQDAIVPSPLMPHLMADWLMTRARKRWPGRSISTVSIGAEPGVPWQRSGEDGTHYVSFAEWMCPINCIEPARCPATRGERTWSMPPTLQRYAEIERAEGRDVLGPFVFHCTHRAYGVGMIDVIDVLAADAAIASTPAARTDILVGTASHCHGALRRVRIGAA